MNDKTEVIRDLFEKHADDIYRYARYTLPTSMDAKHVVQEVFLRALRSWGDFQGRSDPKTWLLKIARNYIYDLLRRNRRERLYEKGSSLTATPSAQLDTIIELEEALNSLSLSHRQILSLRWIQGLTVEEASDVLGWSEAKVRVTFHRAKKKLREFLLDPKDMLEGNGDGGEKKYGG